MTIGIKNLVIAAATAWTLSACATTTNKPDPLNAVCRAHGDAVQECVRLNDNRVKVVFKPPTITP